MYRCCGWSNADLYINYYCNFTMIEKKLLYRLKKYGFRGFYKFVTNNVEFYDILTAKVVKV